MFVYDSKNLNGQKHNMSLKLLPDIVQMLMKAQHPLAVLWRKGLVRKFGGFEHLILTPKQMLRIWKKAVKNYEKENGRAT